MNINDLLRGKTDCLCGKDHVCPIKHVIIQENAIDELAHTTAGYNDILVVADSNTFDVCGRRVTVALGDKLADTLIYNRRGVLVPNEEAIAELDERVTASTDLIIGVGSGVINDLCKHVSHKHGLPYYIVATAPSMDGYASNGAALILDGMKVTLNANVPRAIIADVDALASAPFEMIQAGYGDIIGKYSCLNDWKLSHLVNGEYICNYVMDLTYETVADTASLADGLNRRDRKAVKALMEALVAVGILMSYVGNSRPASGSEHHLSHYFEIVGIVHGEKYFPHGIDVCYSAIETARLRERLLEIEDINAYSAHFEREKYEQNIRRIYGSVADEVLALQHRLGWYDVDRVAVYREKWADICDILADCPSSAQMLKLTQKIGLSYDDFNAMYGEKRISDARLYAKDLKDRYSVLWMYFDLLR
ncbi:MAG: sn-glycerol-1-phosphate dehydrogenase [Ruminococcaceae bacterium]|nr:sn-glycerol-1-phosphate dehydrogenase [Oscillospiraceae bacterium]